MKRIAFLLALPVFVLPLAAAAPPKECALCAGAVSDLQVAPATPVPLLVRLRQEDLAAAGTALDSMSPAVRAKISVIVSYAAETGKDPMAEAETHTQAIVDWAKQHGPFEGLGVDVANVDATVGGYAIKRLAVTAQGQNAASKIVFAGVASRESGVGSTPPSASPDFRLPTPDSPAALY